MTVFEVLTVLTFVVSTATMLMVFISVLPHMKEGMSLVRDAILWAALVIVVISAAYLGWTRLSGQAKTQAEIGKEDFATNHP